MRKTSTLALSMLAAVLLCSAFSTLVSAADNTSSATAPPCDPKAVPDQATNGPPTSGASDNTTLPDDEINAMIADQRAKGVFGLEPGPVAENDLLATQTGASNNDLTFVVAGIMSAVAVSSVIGVVYYRKQAA